MIFDGMEEDTRTWTRKVNSLRNQLFNKALKLNKINIL